MLTRVAEHISQQRGRAPCRPFVRILSLAPHENRANSVLRFEADFPFSAEITAASDVERRELPGGEAVSALHGDPIDSFFRAFNSWPVIIQYATEQGYMLDGSWAANGGWQEFVETPPVFGKGHESRLFLPVSR